MDRFSKKIKRAWESRERGGDGGGENLQKKSNSKGNDIATQYIEETLQKEFCTWAMVKGTEKMRGQVCKPR